MTISQTEYVHRFDAKGAVIGTEEKVVDVTADVVELDTHTKLRAWRGDNRAFLAIDTPTANQTAAQVKRLTRQVNAMMRLLVRDLLTDETAD